MEVKQRAVARFKCDEWICKFAFVLNYNYLLE